MNYKFAASGTGVNPVQSGQAKEDRKVGPKGKSGLSTKQQNMQGQFLQSKQMVFGAEKRLIPSSESVQSENVRENKQMISSYSKKQNQSDNLNDHLIVHANHQASARSDNVLQAAQ